MSVDASTKRLASLLKRLRAVPDERTHAPSHPAMTPCRIVQEIIFATLLWESSTAAALSALRRLHEQVVDANDLRVCATDDLAGIIGDRYPLARERAMRLRSALGSIYQRHHGLDLTPLSSAPKREAAAYIESLEGLPAFAASRVLVTCLDAHALPMDARLRDLLERERVLGRGTPLPEAASWLARQVRAEDALAAHLALQAWSDEEGHAPRSGDRTTGPAVATPHHPAPLPPRDAKTAKSAKPSKPARAKPSRDRTAPAKGTKS